MISSHDRPVRFDSDPPKTDTYRMKSSFNPAAHQQYVGYRNIPRVKAAPPSPVPGFGQS